MTPEAQRIAIAEACPALFRVLDTPNATVIRRSDQSVIDPLTDLNAMHEAEKRLSRVQERDSNGERLPTQWEKYCWLLKFNLDATAAQRAEAFLKILNKWKD